MLCCIHAMAFKPLLEAAVKSFFYQKKPKNMILWMADRIMKVPTASTKTTKPPSMAIKDK